MPGIMAAMELRLARTSDGAGIQAVYGPVVAETVISFEYEVPDAAEMSRRVEARWPSHPWVVAEEADRILGYAYAGPFSGRAAYDWSTEVSVYVGSAARGRGVGRALYAGLFELLRLQGYAQAYAGIALPNPASVAVHEALGFVAVGCYRNVGWKHGAWHDVGWWQLPLRGTTADGQGHRDGDGTDGDGPPAPVRPLDVLTPDEIAAALR